MKLVRYVTTQFFEAHLHVRYIRVSVKGAKVFISIFFYQLMFPIAMVNLTRNKNIHYPWSSMKCHFCLTDSRVLTWSNNFQEMMFLVEAGLDIFHSFSRITQQVLQFFSKLCGITIKNITKLFRISIFMIFKINLWKPDILWKKKFMWLVKKHGTRRMSSRRCMPVQFWWRFSTIKWKHFVQRFIYPELIFAEENTFQFVAYPICIRLDTLCSKQIASFRLYRVPHIKWILLVFHRNFVLWEKK